MEWWKTYFQKDYLLLYPPESQSTALADDVDFIVSSLSLPHGGKVLDLGCGYGRHVVHLAKYGYEVEGYDLSSDLLDIAKDKYSGPGITYQQGDMRNLPYQNEFNGIVNLFTSFGLFTNDKENEQVVGQVAKALKPGGKFLLELWNPERVQFQGRIKNWRENPSNHSIVLELYERDIAKSRLKAIKILYLEGQRREYVFDIRIYSLAELTSIFERYNLHIYQVFGNFRDETLSASSPRMVVLAVKE